MASIVGSAWATNVQMIQRPGAPEGFLTPDVADIYLADADVNPGNSGGPVYLVEDATVIGVCVSSKPAPVRNQKGEYIVIEKSQLGYSSGLANIIPSKYVIDLLKRRMIPSA